MYCTCAEEDVSEAARALVGLVEAVDNGSRGWGATFILELFRGSPTARNKALVGTVALVYNKQWLCCMGQCLRDTLCCLLTCKISFYLTAVTVGVP